MIGCQVWEDNGRKRLEVEDIAGAKALGQE